MKPTVPTCAFACKLSEATTKAKTVKPTRPLAPLTTLQVFDSQQK